MENLNRYGKYLFFVLWSGTILYVGYSSAAEKGDWFFVTWCAVIAGIPAYGIVTALVRSRAMKKFAAANDLAYLGASLPKGLLVARSSFAQKPYEYSNCVTGELGCANLAVFDLSYRRGKGSRSQTIVAFPRSGPGAIAGPPIDAVGSFEFEAAGDWIIGYIPGRTVATNELHDWCLELYTLAHDLLAESRGDGEPRPRLFRWMT